MKWFTVLTIGTLTLRRGESHSSSATSTRPQRGTLAVAAFIVMLVSVSCASSDEMGAADETTSTVEAAAPTVAGCANVVEVDIEPSGDTYRVSATILSADTGWEKYADAWEVRSPDGTILGTRILAHPHVDEQPFTRSLSGIDIPVGVTDVDIAARDSVMGFCGETVSVAVPGR